MSEHVLPFTCILLTHLRVSPKSSAWRSKHKNSDETIQELTIHGASEMPGRNEFEFSIDDAYLTGTPYVDGKKRIAEFAIAPESATNKFLHSLDQRLRELTVAHLKCEMDECHWTPLLLDNDILKTCLALNAQGQPSLVCKDEKTGERISLYQLKQGAHLRLVLSIPQIYTIKKDNKKNHTGKHKCGALLVVRLVFG